MKKTFLILSLFFTSLFVSAQVTVIDSFLHGGLMRTYRLYIPAIYNGSSAVPVVLNLHGYTSNAMQQELYGDFRPIADTANFIIAHPDGTFDATNNRFWNTFGLSPVDDIGFISALLDTISAQYNVNQNRIYATGMSNGGYLSHMLACTLSGRITAIASVTGTMTLDMKTNCAASHPTPAMQIHGTADAVVPYAGTGINLPIDTVVKHWVVYNQCNPIPVFTAVPDVVPGDACTAEHYLYNNGKNGATVEFYKVIGGGHTWPGAPFVVGVTNMDFSASKEIWRFFSQYSLANLATGTVNTIKTDLAFTVYPNPASRQVCVNFTNDQQKELSVFNTMGERVYFFNTAALSTTIEIMQPGIYFLQVKDEKKVSTQRVIIE